MPVRQFLPCDAMHNADYVVTRCLSAPGCRIVKMFSIPGSPTIIVFFSREYRREIIEPVHPAHCSHV